MVGAGRAKKPCGLIAKLSAPLHSAWSADPSSFVLKFRPSAVILSPPFDHAPAMILAVEAYDLAVLLADNLAEAKALGASGVYFTGDAKGVSRARSTFGNAIIGAACALTRHDAMEQAEAGADFIAFEVAQQNELHLALELALWWDEVTEVPCALACDPAWLDRALLQGARFDFLLLNEDQKAGSSLTFATEFGLISET